MYSVEEIDAGINMANNTEYNPVPELTREDFKRHIEKIPGEWEETKSYLLKHLDHDVIVGFYDNEEESRIVISFDHMQYLTSENMRFKEDTVLTNLYYACIRDFCSFVFPSKRDPLYLKYLESQGEVV